MNNISGGSGRGREYSTPGNILKNVMVCMSACVCLVAPFRSDVSQKLDAFRVSSDWRACLDLDFLLRVQLLRRLVRQSWDRRVLLSLDSEVVAYQRWCVLYLVTTYFLFCVVEIMEPRLYWQRETCSGGMTFSRGEARSVSTFVV